VKFGINMLIMGAHQGAHHMGVVNLVFNSYYAIGCKRVKYQHSNIQAVRQEKINVLANIREWPQQSD